MYDARNKYSSYFINYFEYYTKDLERYRTVRCRTGKFCQKSLPFVKICESETKEICLESSTLSPQIQTSQNQFFFCEDNDNESL